MSDLINNPALLPPGGPVGAPAPTTPSQAPSQAPTGPSFADVLADQTAGTNAPSFSKHAMDRLSRRGIEMNSQTLGRLTNGIQRAADKGARNSVVFVDGTAFVASVQNNTVITAVTPEAMNSHVFTNIDSAVIA
ncbi:MAG TPA: TIGR02530 family flagellar biosynthesis protein [Solirubrobacteraceae bacterium]|nr:TIGR02530 family flagellar biosynthesis protein [Solirubrobacteraceae bacterium]